MKNLIEEIRSRSGISQIQAELALGAMLSFLAARLPSPIMGRIKEAIAHNQYREEQGPSIRKSTRQLGNADE